MALPGEFPTDYTTLASNLDKNSKLVKLVLNNELNKFYLIDDEGAETEITTSGSPSSSIVSSFDAIVDTNYRPDDFDNYLYLSNNTGVSNPNRASISLFDAGDGNEIALVSPIKIRLESDVTYMELYPEGMKVQSSAASLEFVTNGLAMDIKLLSDGAISMSNTSDFTAEYVLVNSGNVIVASETGNVIIYAGAFGITVDQTGIKLTGLPVVEPGSPGYLWNDADTIKIS